MAPSLTSTGWPSFVGERPAEQIRDDLGEPDLARLQFDAVAAFDERLPGGVQVFELARVEPIFDVDEMAGWGLQLAAGLFGLTNGENGSMCTPWITNVPMGSLGLLLRCPECRRHRPILDFEIGDRPHHVALLRRDDKEQAACARA